METNTNPWISLKYKEPPQGEMVEIKIDDEDGIRNEGEQLMLRGNLWYTESMYVYYTPTHWRYLANTFTYIVRVLPE